MAWQGREPLACTGRIRAKGWPAYICGHPSVNAAGIVVRSDSRRRPWLGASRGAAARAGVSASYAGIRRDLAVEPSDHRSKRILGPDMADPLRAPAIKKVDVGSTGPVSAPGDAASAAFLVASGIITLVQLGSASVMDDH